MWGIFILIIPAFLYNLGLRVFYEDESIRCLVALEMMLSGNYITPTLNDTFYYSKPPLYNWIIILFFKVLGGINEWTARIPTIIFLGFYTYFIYWINKQYLDRKHSLYVALAFLTCGRILFWDSMLGYIDILYSLFSYGLIVFIYHVGRRSDSEPRLFWGGMLLFSIGYMLKGFPSILFLIISAGVFILLYQRWHYFKSKHLYLSLMLPLIIIGGYYLAYSTINDVSKTIEPLLDQSTRRTIVRYDIADMIRHLFTYPFENVFHFLPWSLFIICCFRSDFFKVLKENDFVQYCFYALAANILVYWVSPEVYPRYILMLVPLSFTIFFYFYQKDNSWRVKLLAILMKIVVYSAPLIVLFSLYMSYVKLNNWDLILISVAAFLSLIVAVVYYRIRDLRVLTLVLLCLVLRVVFNTTILPDRHHGDFAVKARADAIDLAVKYPDVNISLYKNSKLDYTGSLYLSNTRQLITTRTDSLRSGYYYLIDTSRVAYPSQPYYLLDSLVKREDQKSLYLIKMK